MDINDVIKKLDKFIEKIEEGEENVLEHLALLKDVRYVAKDQAHRLLTATTENNYIKDIILKSTKRLNIL